MNAAATLPRDDQGADGTMSAFSLSGKVALVTGASRGLGRAIAIGLAAAGADIVGFSRSSMADTARAVEKLGRRCHVIAIDLRDRRKLDQALAECFAHFPRVDVLVNNAGIIRREKALEYSESDWDDVLEVNLKQVFALSQKLARHFADHGGGKIINIASMLSFQGGRFVPAYTASKSGILGLTRALANEWAPLRINVNAIAPGYFITDATAAIRQDSKRSAEILARIPAGRWGDPDDLRGAAVFLASSASDYIHGAVIPVDGGWLSS